MGNVSKVAKGREEGRYKSEKRDNAEIAGFLELPTPRAYKLFFEIFTAIYWWPHVW